MPGVYNIHIASKLKNKLLIVLLIVFNKISDIIQIQCLQLLKNIMMTHLKSCNSMNKEVSYCSEQSELL